MIRFSDVVFAIGIALCACYPVLSYGSRNTASCLSTGWCSVLYFALRVWTSLRRVLVLVLVLSVAVTHANGISIVARCHTPDVNFINEEGGAAHKKT